MLLTAMEVAVSHMICSMNQLSRVALTFSLLSLSFPSLYLALDRCELKEVFSSMGVPISEKALSDIMDRFDDDNDGTIDFAGK